MLTAADSQMLKNHSWKFIWGIILSLTTFTACTVFSGSQKWKTYYYDGYVAFSLEYPAKWTTAQKERHVVLFSSPDDDVRIEIVVYDLAETPPLPVDITYDTLRVVNSRPGPVPVLKRDPAAVTERYVAFLNTKSHIAEFQLHAISDYDEIFDHMLATTRPITSHTGNQNEKNN